MKKNIVTFLSFFLTVIVAVCYGHSSQALHYDDILCIFNGYGDKNFQELYTTISSGIDNELPNCFREVIGPIPGNHRLLGHGWTLNESIPKDTMELLLKRYPGKEKQIIGVWSKLVREWNILAVNKTGLPPQQAKALASLIYDIHLLGDLEPDNKLLDPVLNIRHLFNSIKKNSRILFQNSPQYANLICRRLDTVLATTRNPQLAAQLANDCLRDIRLGTMLNSTFGDKMKIHYSIDRAITANTKNAMRKMRDTIPISQNSEYLAQQFSHMMTPGHIPHHINKIQVVKGILREIDKNGRKALILELPFQFSVEQRAASAAAKKMILTRGYEKLSPEFLESVKGIAKTAALSASKKTGGSLSITEAETIADKAVAWARISPKNAALKNGVITFVISEGFTLYRYYESDLTEKELMFETTKNATQALVLGSATYCLVALGATPGGLIVIGVGIGLTMITDFAFTQMKEEFFDPGFSLEDIIGGIPANIRLRRTIWEPGLDQKSLFNIDNHGTSILEPIYKKNGIHNSPTHSGNLFDIHENHTSIFDSKQ